MSNLDVETPARKEPRILEKHGHSKELRAVSTPQPLGFLLLGQACFEFLLVKMAGWLPSRIVIATSFTCCQFWANQKPQDVQSARGSQGESGLAGQLGRPPFTSHLRLAAGNPMKQCPPPVGVMVSGLVAVVDPCFADLHAKDHSCSCR